MTAKDPELAYLAGLRRLLREEAPFDPVKQVIRARLEGVREPVQGLISPPLGRDEPDTSLLLLYLYDQLRRDQDRPARDRLRRVAVELLEEALNAGAGFRAINRLGQLVGAFEVRRSEPLAGRLRTWLWGYLDSRLPQPGEALILLTGDALIRARQILDLWLAVTPPLPPGWPEHYAGKIRLFFDKAVEQTRQDHFSLSKPRFHLLTLLYRGLLKLCPEYAGWQYPTLCRLAQGTRERDARGIWLALCWEYGVLLGADQAWRKYFAQGLTSIREDEKRHYRERSDSELNDLFWRGLEYLDHLEQELYLSESTPPYLDLEVAGKPKDTARLHGDSDSESGRLYLSESTSVSPGLKVADEPKDTSWPYGYSDSESGKFYPLGLASKLLRPLVLDSKPVPAA
ncbi:hypothetical protein [Candidatus Thiosymbion oneisti]|uniref:hypothetical protein n=1 Tax=Candidatus Thiosymbion oneisti TaxID=589554 RepID=UPI000B7E54B7|nr:hypothetical protein [Candidatus Thiosymbion oneisti]